MISTVRCAFFVVGVSTLGATAACTAEQSCDATLAEYNERTRAIVASHAAPCDDVSDCARPLEACTNGDFDCRGALACEGGSCFVAF